MISDRCWYSLASTLKSRRLENEICLFNSNGFLGDGEARVKVNLGLMTLEGSLIYLGQFSSCIQFSEPSISATVGLNVSLWKVFPNILPYHLSDTPCLGELQSQKTGLVWEYKARWHFPGEQQDNADPATPCPHHSAQQLQLPFISFPNAAARWKRNPKRAARDIQHKVAFSALEVSLQKAPAKYPGTSSPGASQCHWSISVPLVTQDTADCEDSVQPPPATPACSHLPHESIAASSDPR